MYQVKWLPELGWAVAIAVAVVLASALVTFDPASVSDWRAWAVALAASVVRVAAATVLNELRKRVPSP